MRHFLSVATVTFLLLPAGAGAAELSTSDIITSLDALQGYAVAITTNDPSVLSKAALAGQLDKLPQLNVDIQFELDSDAVLPQSYRAVGQIADALHHPLLLGSRFLIVGHTDSSGSNDHNLELSRKRADAILAMLATTFRVAPGRLVAIGLGEEQPRDPADPKSPINRRVQLINIGPYDK